MSDFYMALRAERDQVTTQEVDVFMPVWERGEYGRFDSNLVAGAVLVIAEETSVNEANQLIHRFMLEKGFDSKMDGRLSYHDFAKINGMDEQDVVDALHRLRDGG